MDTIELMDKGKAFFRLEMHPEGWLQCTWFGNISDKKVREGGIKMIEATKKTGCPYLINDNTQLEGSWLSAIDWIESELEPALRKAGNKFTAHILAKDFISKFSAIELEARLSRETLKMFYSQDEAEEWMREVK